HQPRHGLKHQADWPERFPQHKPRRPKAIVAQWRYEPLDGPVHYQVEAREDGRLPEPDSDSVVVRRSHPRRDALQRAAARVRNAAEKTTTELDGELAQRIDWVLDRANVPVTNDVHMPEHISTSRLVELARNP